MFTKIDVRQIVADHWHTLRDYGRNRQSPADVGLFVVLPVALALGGGLLGFVLSGAAVGVIITALAVFAGLLFNLLLLAHGIIRRADTAPHFADERKLLEEVYSNIAYAILAAITCIVVLLGSFIERPDWVPRAISAVGLAVLAHFLLTLLMILKRVHVLLSREFRKT